MNIFYPGDCIEKLISINISNHTDFVIDKAVFTCGTLRKEIKPVTNPIVISVTSEESAQFTEINTCFLDVFNLQGEKKHVSGKYIFKTQDKYADDISELNVCIPQGLSADFVLMLNPTKLSELENDIGFITKADITENIVSLVGETIVTQDFMEEILNDEVITLKE